MSRPAKLHRRTFLAASSVLAAPYFIPFLAFGANEQIVTAHLGVGGQGNSKLNGFLGKGVSPAVICDVDRGHLARAVKLATDNRGRWREIGITQP